MSDIDWREFKYPSPEFFADPQPFYGALREAGTHRLPELQPPTFLVSRYDDVVWAYRHPEIFSSIAPNPASLPGVRFPEIPAIHNNDPPSSTIYRAAASRLLAPGRLREYKPLFASLSNELIDGFIDRREVDWVNEFAIHLPLTVITVLLGLPREMISQFRRWSEAFQVRMAMADHGYSGSTTAGRDAEEQTQAFREYIADEIEVRRKMPRNDIISNLIASRVKNEGSLTTPELLEIVFVLLRAGNDTTSRLLAFLMILLTDHPDVMKSVRTNRQLIPRLIDEALRLEPTVQYPFPRWVKQDVEVAGVTIPVGSRVLLMNAAANRDERQFQDANEFKLDRSNLKDHVAFGHAGHFCLGAPLARMEVEAAYNVVFDRLAHIRRASRQGSIAWEEYTPHFRGPLAFLIEFDDAAQGPA